MPVVGVVEQGDQTPVLLFALVVSVLPPRLAHEGMGARRRHRLALQAGNRVVDSPRPLGGEVIALSAGMSRPRGIEICCAILTFQNRSVPEVTSSVIDHALPCIVAAWTGEHFHVFAGRSQDGDPSRRAQLPILSAPIKRV